MNRQVNLKNFPALDQEIHWGEVHCVFELIQDIPSQPLISNVNLIPFVDDDSILLRLRDSRWEIPGGTIEPGESYMDTIRRELLEEAGALLLNFKPFGLFRCHSSAGKPFRPHLPHPLFHRLVGYGEVKIVTKPSNPEGGERVVAVERLPLVETVKRFREMNRFELAELYLLASKLRNEAP